MCIRLEKYGDSQQITSVTVAAFREAIHTNHTEQFIVSAIRNSGALAISLVAEASSKIIGHVALSAVSISDGSSDWYGLGPISVHPNEQRKGVGSKLMHEAISELKKHNANCCVLLGDPDYYGRFGFKQIDSLVLPDVPIEYFQTLLFQGTYPKGEVTYHKAFLAVN